MEVIKVVSGYGEGVWRSSHARLAWEQEYHVGKATTPDIGLLFAYPNTSNGLSHAKSDTGGVMFLAEAEVVGKVNHSSLDPCQQSGWHEFWNHFKPKKVGRYLLCSSITLLERIE